MVVARFVQTLINKREVTNGKLFELRNDDLRILAAVFGKTVDEFTTRCNEIGILAHETSNTNLLESL